MKRYSSYLIIFGFLLLWSCSKDFLDREPLDKLPPKYFFKTANDLKLFANRFYQLLPAHSGYGGGTFWYEKNSDNLVPGSIDLRLSGTRTIPSTEAGWVWTDIRQANYFLENCNTADDDPENIKVYIAEVRFFKALLYFDKLKTFGDVPWINKALNTESPELYAPRDKRNVVVDSIVTLLDSAIIDLKPTTSTEPFRINREAAILMKARICLYEGTWEKYHAGTAFGVAGLDGTKFIRLAAESADQLMQTGTFSLYKGPDGTEYWSLFNKLDYTDNPEVILWKSYDVGLGVYHHASSYLSGAAGDIGIARSLIDSYLCTDGKPITVSPEFMGYDSLEAEVMNRDPRLRQSIFMKGYDQSINSPGGNGDVKFVKPTIDKTGQFRSTTGYCIYKGVNPEFSQHTSAGGTMGSIILRYTEALLIYAEAKAELGTINQNDIDITVNAIRDRVSMIHLDMSNITTDPNWDYPELSPLINEIRRERRIELAFENMRWDDLARWRAHHLLTGKRPGGILYKGSNLEGTYFDYLGNPTIVLGQNLFVDANGFIDPYQGALPSGFGFDSGRDYLSPIPSNEITLNENLIQNPGWN